MKAFEQKLAELKNLSIEVAADNTPDDEGTAGITIRLSDGTFLAGAYWRLIHDGHAVLSSFDHQKKYGLPAPIDAKEQIASLLAGQICRNVQFDRETADLILIFDGRTRLQVFNFTAFEMWTLRFPDGTGEYSNYALHE
jgi:hypothetical protein